jgi:hypothetical protein
VPVGHTRWYEDFVLRDESDPFIPGTTVRRVKTVDLGPKARAHDQAEIDRVAAELAALPHKPWRKPRGTAYSASTARRQTRK